MNRLTVAVIITVLAILGAVIWWQVSLSPVNPADQKAVAFVIAKGDGVREVAKKLRDEGLIRDQVAFFILVKKLGIEKDIQAGNYQIAPNLSATDIASKLTLGTADTWVTIPEGWRTEQITEYLSTILQVGLTNSQIGEWKKLEGKLFPDTYSVPKDSSVSAVLTLMQANFSKKVDFPVSANQLIIASMIEREAKSAADRPIVASVIYNRLNEGMALDIDATVQYALGKVPNDGWWKKQLTADDLKIDSPYNTYLNPGLPPGPICNPGLSSIQAAVNPAQTSYFYYISDKNQVMHFAKTLDEQNQNIAKYL